MHHQAIVSVHRDERDPLSNRPLVREFTISDDCGNTLLLRLSRATGATIRLFDEHDNLTLVYLDKHLWDAIVYNAYDFQTDCEEVEELEQLQIDERVAAYVQRPTPPAPAAIAAVLPGPTQDQEPGIPCDIEDCPNAATNALGNRSYCAAHYAAAIAAGEDDAIRRDLSQRYHDGLLSDIEFADAILALKEQREQATQAELENRAEEAQEDISEFPPTQAEPEQPEHLASLYKLAEAHNYRVQVEGDGLLDVIQNDLTGPGQASTFDFSTEGVNSAIAWLMAKIAEATQAEPEPLKCQIEGCQGTLKDWVCQECGADYGTDKSGYTPVSDEEIAVIERFALTREQY